MARLKNVFHKSTLHCPFEAERGNSNMKQPGVILVLIIFVAAVSFVVASEQYQQGRMATTTLTGLAEVGHFGDPNGTGIFKYKVDRAQNLFCYELSVTDIETATSAAVHSGTRDAQGSSLITL